MLNCQTGPYRLAILTSKDDETVGESIPGSTGNPSTNYAAAVALHFYVGYNFYSDLRYVRIAHAQTAIQYDAPTYDAGSPNRLAHSQLVHCQRGIVPNNMGFLLRNVLMNNVLTNFYNTGNSPTGRVEHLTIDQANLMQGNTNITESANAVKRAVAMLRREVATVITRKATPNLRFVVLPAGSEEADGSEEVDREDFA